MSTRSFALANQKGGVGKTTTSVSLAACLAEKGLRTLLLDLDPQANATSALGLDKLEGGSVYNALLGSAQLATGIRPTGIPNLDMIPSEVDLAVAEVDVARTDNYLQRLQLALNPIRESGQYDFLLIDCPPSLGILTMNALAAVDRVVVPIQCEYFAMEGLTQMIQVIRGVMRKQPGRLEFGGILLTMYDSTLELTAEVENEVREFFGDIVFDAVIPRDVAVSESPSHGLSVIDYQPRSRGTRAYLELCQEILNR
jgi:chromosome partitioning protein